jgi:Protein of unknown function (DUF3301)
MLDIGLLITLVVLALFWFDSIGSRDQAILIGRELTQKIYLQFLDESVACQKIRLGRNQQGRVQILRTYTFEVSSTGGDRFLCELTLLGRELNHWYIPPYPQAIH